MRPSIVREIERGTRYGLVTVLAIGVRRRDPGAAVNAILGFVGISLPDVIERRYDMEFRPWQRVYLETAMLTHAVGMLGQYDDVWWWDHLTHTHSATILGGLTFAAARRRGRDPRPRVIAVVACAGILWELVEYTIHATANRIGFEPVLVTYGKTDTFYDLVFNLVGAGIVLVLGDHLLGNFTASAGDRR
ncbi:hypothetical protein [Natrinema salsiterrestre]|uniref:DUF2238 domain-containing protein n=1 Tax=Natrinema salsiterrestre TaxID=2950540 RepID=A0A9Q4Q1C5_9EURY|nr:hypothetical protein [Natrinema salsiterrestre]MDF9747089.1 hypothetical protein [Natrinema salsiterrestre]